MKNILTALGIVATIGIFIFLSIYFSKNTSQQVSLQVEQGANASSTEAAEPRLVVTPMQVLQGEPVMVRVENGSSTVKEIFFAGKSIPFFIYDSAPTAFVAIDLGKKTGEYPVKIEMTDRKFLFATSTVLVRPKNDEALGVPEKLGGNTPAAEKNVVDDLALENAVIKALPSAGKSLWSEAFQYPVNNPIVTDPYGYTRITGAYSISHLGVDFKADEGTPVFAMNRGVVTFATSTIIYGTMIVIDHGLGLETLYLHLSKILINKGDLVSKGQEIGESGQTGYATEPHLHLSIKINTISIDPIKFLDFFKK